MTALAEEALKLQSRLPDDTLRIVATGVKKDDIAPTRGESLLEAEDLFPPHRVVEISDDPPYKAVGSLVSGARDG